MGARPTREAARGAVPELGGSVRVPGLEARADVWRDPEGVPHVRARSAGDAFLAQGFVHAQDRLWHMHADRRRALGRWAEYGGPAAVPRDLRIDEPGQVQGLGARPERRDRAMGHRAEPGGRWPLLQACQQRLGPPQVGDDEGAGLAVDAARFDDLPVLAAPNRLGHERRHA